MILSAKPRRLKRTVLIDFVDHAGPAVDRHGKPGGAIFYDNRIERMIPARSGRIQVLRPDNDLLKQPAKFRRPPFTNPPLDPLLESGLFSIKKTRLVFRVSDFICEPGWNAP